MILIRLDCGETMGAFVCIPGILRRDRLLLPPASAHCVPLNCITCLPASAQTPPAFSNKPSHDVRRLPAEADVSPSCFGPTLLTRRFVSSSGDSESAGVRERSARRTKAREGEMGCEVGRDGTVEDEEDSRDRWIWIRAWVDNSGRPSAHRSVRMMDRSKV